MVLACRGFDPLRLFQNPSVRPWLVEGELYNGRIAMLAAAGGAFELDCHMLGTLNDKDGALMSSHFDVLGSLRCET